MNAPSHAVHWALPPIESYATGVSSHSVQRSTAGQVTQTQDVLIEELPVSLEFIDSNSGDKTALVMMATPLDLEAFALGFCLTEGIVDKASQVLSCEAVPAKYGMAVLVTLAAGKLSNVAARQRDKAATSSCALCGLQDMQAALQAPKVAPSRWTVSAVAIATAFKQLPQLQVLGAQTGAAHAAAFVNTQGHILAIAEDAGRHNALDKLVGKLVQLGLNPHDGLCAITSRASFEMVQKAARVGFPMLAAISAPTALAVRLAQESGITLCGFVREARLSCFAHAHRISV